MKSTFITGGAGFVGSNLANAFLAAGHPVTIFDSLVRPGTEQNLEWLRQQYPETLTFIMADVRDADAVAVAGTEADIIYHLAGQVELVRLYSNPAVELVMLQRVRHAASSPRPAEGLRHARQQQRRLDVIEVTELIKEYEQQASINELAGRFGIHRVTVTALLRRHGVELRQVGLEAEEIPAAAHLYGQGWSLARLGARFGVDAATVWRALRVAGVEMRSPSQRPARSE